MAVCYVSMEIRLHGLSLKSEAQYEELRLEIERRLRSAPLPYQRDLSDSDIEVQFSDEITIAGKFES